MLIFSLSHAGAQRPPDTTRRHQVDTANQRPPSDTFFHPITRQVIQTVFERYDIYPSKGALKVVALLNPGLQNKLSIDPNYPIILPQFPAAPADATNKMNTAFTQALLFDGAVNDLLVNATKRFDSIARLYSTSNVIITDGAGHQTDLRVILASLSQWYNELPLRILLTSKSTVGLLHRETVALNDVLLANIDRQPVAADFNRRMYLLVTDIKFILYHILGKEKITSLNLLAFISDAAGPHIQHASYSTTSPVINPFYNRFLFSKSDPQKFNIYVFRTEKLKTNNNPEMNAYDIEYVYPGLASDEALWDRVNGEASTSACYFPPARVIFKITEKSTGNVYEDTEDLFNAHVDTNKGWSLSDLFYKTYKLAIVLE